MHRQRRRLSKTLRDHVRSASALSALKKSLVANLSAKRQLSVAKLSAKRIFSLAKRDFLVANGRMAADFSSPEKVPVTAANVRDTVVCSVCDKPRCLFAVKKLTQADAAAITQMKEDVNCVCGGTVIPSDDPLSKKVGTRLDIACTSEVSSHYFASKRGLPPVCYKCGCVNPLPISAETAARYQSVHPLCQECKNKGFSLRTRGERKVRR